MNEPENTRPTGAIEKHDLRRMQDVLESLEQQIKRQTSFKYAFLRGAVYGLGTVIGATILIAIFGGLIAGFINQLGHVPFVGNYVNEQAFDQYIEE